jgi:hypothetical protein
MQLKSLVLPVAILALMGNGYADEKNLDSYPMKDATSQASSDLNKSDHVFTMEKAPKKMEAKSEISEKNGKKNEVVEVADLKTQNPNLFFFNVDFLWWKAKGNGWIYIRDIDFFEPGSPLLDEDYFRGNSEWNPGARIEVGFSTPLEWNIGGIYTYYHNESESKKRNVILTLGQTTYNINLSTTKLHTDYNVLDLELTSSCFWHKYLIIKPIFGARGAWIKYGYHDKYYYSTNTEQFQTIRNKYSAGGPRMGVDAYFKVGGGFDFMGGITASLLYGHMSASFARNFLSATTTIDHEKFSDLKGTLQMQLGANWKYFFDKDTKAFSLHLLWENNYWIDLGDVRHTLGMGFPETFYTYGLNFGCGFEF